jgi:hypothetical protein
MPRPFNRRQMLENDRFLAALRRTGNARLAARELGVHRATYTKRRARCSTFAADWDAALALAHARLNQSCPRLLGEGGHAKHGGGAPRVKADEPVVTRLANGRLQLRAPGARRIGRPEQQAFLAALSATANVRLAARAAGFAHSSFYRLRDHNPAFAREMRLALQMGYDRIEMALLESFAPESARDDAWRVNDAPPIPPMTASQALQLLYLHQKEARLWDERPDRRRKRGESRDEYCARLGRKCVRKRRGRAKATKPPGPSAKGAKPRPTCNRPRPGCPTLPRSPAGARPAPTLAARATRTRRCSAAGG